MWSLFSDSHPFYAVLVLLNWGISLNTSEDSYLASSALLSLVFLHANTGSRCQHFWQLSLVNEHSDSSHTQCDACHGIQFCSKYPHGSDKNRKMWLLTSIRIKSSSHVRDRIRFRGCEDIFLFPLLNWCQWLWEVCCWWVYVCVCWWKCLSILCVVIIEAHLLLWEHADVSLWLRCGLTLKGVYCFITYKCCCGKRVWQRC